MFVPDLVRKRTGHSQAFVFIIKVRPIILYLIYYGKNFLQKYVPMAEDLGYSYFTKFLWFVIIKMREMVVVIFKTISKI